MNRFRRYFEYWTRLEWLGFAFYIHHVKLVTRRTFNADLSPVRALLSLPSFAAGLLIISPFDLYDFSGYRYLRDWLPEDLLGCCYVLHGFCMLWRLYAPSHVPLWGAVLGALGITLYIGFPLAVMADLGHPTVLAFCMIAWGWACIWIAWHVWNINDRSGA